MAVSHVPLLRLNTGAMMPMLAIGTGKISPPASGRRRGRRKERPARGALLGLLNASLSIGFRHIDTSEVYPLFDEVGDALRLFPRTEMFLTSKVDPTRKPGRPGASCRPDGGGCFAAMSAAANSTVRRLGTHVDLLLLHRPPKREGDGNAQCARLRELWRGLEDAYARGLAKAIGLSNCCGPLLECLVGSARTPPAVLQYMLHVGMGPAPLGYRQWAKKTWGAEYMAYSVRTDARIEET